MRTSFELKFIATDYLSAVESAKNHVARFLGIAPDEVESKADTELKVELVDGKYQVTAFSKLKGNNVSFGLPMINVKNNVL
jgi:hypothetical protein